MVQFISFVYIDYMATCGYKFGCCCTYSWHSCSWTWDFSCDEDLVSSEDNLNLSINWYHYLCLSLFSFQARLINKSSNVCTKQRERTVQLNGTNGFISKSPEALNESQGFAITIHLSQTPGDRGWVSCCCSVILHIQSRNPIFSFCCDVELQQPHG